MRFYFNSGQHPGKRILRFGKQINLNVYSYPYTRCSKLHVEIDDIYDEIHEFKEAEVTVLLFCQKRTVPWRNTTAKKRLCKSKMFNLRMGFRIRGRLDIKTNNRRRRKKAIIRVQRPDFISWRFSFFFFHCHARIKSFFYFCKYFCVFGKY